MNNTRKMYLVPYQQGRGAGDESFQQDLVSAADVSTPDDIVTPRNRGNSIRKYAAERHQKLLQIVLRLAAFGGYDEHGRISTSNGESLDIVPLLLYASSPGRNVRGISDFVELLYNANVSPDWIINSSVKEELSKRITYGGKREQKTPQRKQRQLMPATAPSQMLPPVNTRTLRQEAKERERAQQQ